MMDPRDGEITNIDMESGTLSYYAGSTEKGTIKHIPIAPEWINDEQIKEGNILPDALRLKQSQHKRGNTCPGVTRT